ncbi:MAG: fatty acid desaturase [Leptospiraceae bacterium]|nr:fatty acid desaturase [Leptospiraceae bacterium]
MESNQSQHIWKEYSGHVAYPTAFLALGCLAGFMGSSVAYALGALPLWLAMFLNAFIGYLIFTPLHEASHSNIGTRKGVWKWFDSAVGWLSGAVLIAPFSAFKVLHLRHHSNTNDPDMDPDHWMATSNPLLLTLRGLTIIPRYYYHFFAHADKQAKDKMPATFAGILVLAAIYSFWAYFTDPMQPLLLWIIPAMVALAFLAMVFDWLPHYPHNSRDRYKNTRVLPGSFLNVVLLGQNYHLIHHLYPTVPFYSYRPVFQRTRGFLESKGAPIGWQMEGKASEQPA